MLNIRPKLFDNESPVHHPLIFTQGYGRDKKIMIRKEVYFIATENNLEFLKAFDYRENFVLSLSVVTLCLAQSSLDEGNWFIVLTDNIT